MITHSIAKLILCESIGKSGTRAVLTGEGADEIFCGYPHFRRDLALYGSKTSYSADLQNIGYKKTSMIPNGVVPEDLHWVYNQLSHGISWLDTHVSLNNPISELFNISYLEQYNGLDGYRQFFDRLDKIKITGRSPVHTSMYLFAKTCLPNIVLTTLGDRIEMAGSIEGRPALIDHKVIELICGLPINLKMRGSTEKYILREAMKPYIPQEIYSRKKHYFRAPQTLFKLGKCKLSQIVYDELTSNKFKNIPFFDNAKVLALLNKLPSLTGNQGKRI